MTFFSGLIYSSRQVKVVFAYKDQTLLRKLFFVFIRTYCTPPRMEYTRKSRSRSNECPCCSASCCIIASLRHRSQWPQKHDAITANSDVISRCVALYFQLFPFVVIFPLDGTATQDSRTYCECEHDALIFSKVPT